MLHQKKMKMFALKKRFKLLDHKRHTKLSSLRHHQLEHHLTPSIIQFIHRYGYVLMTFAVINTSCFCSFIERRKDHRLRFVQERRRNLRHWRNPNTTTSSHTQTRSLLHQIQDKAGSCRCCCQYSM